MTSKPITEKEPTLLERVLAGPWERRSSVYGEKCQVCGRKIFCNEGAYVRYGDDLSPAIYRHQECHERNQ